MKNFFTGIYTYFGTTNCQSFSSAIAGRLYLNEAPTTADFPYAIYSLVANEYDENWHTGYDEALVDFELYSDSTGGATEITDLYEHLKTGFDNANFSVTSNSLLRFKRENAWLNKLPDVVPNKSIWQYVVQYRCLLRNST